MQEIEKKSKLIDNFLKVSMILSSILFAMPSIIYYAKKRNYF